jgi:hypothetical protein
VAALSRPIAKSAIKTGVILFDKGREAAAEMGEVFEDLIAEARAELGGALPEESPIAAATASAVDVMGESERQGSPI